VVARRTRCAQQGILLTSTVAWQTRLKPGPVARLIEKISEEDFVGSGPAVGTGKVVPRTKEAATVALGRVDVLRDQGATHWVCLSDSILTGASARSKSVRRMPTLLSGEVVPQWEFGSGMGKNRP
jgi:hypothetical protein